jgi:hypothetical protein
VERLYRAFRGRFCFRVDSRYAVVDGLRRGGQAGEAVAAGIFVRACCVFLFVVGDVSLDADFVVGGDGLATRGWSVGAVFSLERLFGEVEEGAGDLWVTADSSLRKE